MMFYQVVSLCCHVAWFYYHINEINNSRYERNHQKCNYTVRDEIVIWGSNTCV